MNKSGSFVDNLNVDKLNNNICEVEMLENEKPYVYYL